MESVHTELLLSLVSQHNILNDFDPLDLSINSCAGRGVGQLSSGAGAGRSVLLLKSSKVLSQV